MVCSKIIRIREFSEFIFYKTTIRSIANNCKKLNQRLSCIKNPMTILNRIDKVISDSTKAIILTSHNQFFFLPRAKRSLYTDFATSKEIKNTRNNPP